MLSLFPISFSRVLGLSALLHKFDLDFWKKNGKKITPLIMSVNAWDGFPATHDLCFVTLNRCCFLLGRFPLGRFLLGHPNSKFLFYISTQYGKKRNLSEA